MIVELAVGIASNLPLESRDVAIIYHLPEQPIDPRLMEVEKMPLPPLDGWTADSDDEAGSGVDEAVGAGTGSKDTATSDGKDGAPKDRRGGDKTKPGTLNTVVPGGSMGLSPGGVASGPSSRKGSLADESTPQLAAGTAAAAAGGMGVLPSQAQQTQGQGQAQVPAVGGSLSKDPATRVRYAGFVGVEVKGRQVLVKAPVWSIG